MFPGEPKQHKSDSNEPGSGRLVTALRRRLPRVLRHRRVHECSDTGLRLLIEAGIVFIAFQRCVDCHAALVVTLRVSKGDPGAFRRDQPVEDLGPDRIVLGLFDLVNNVRTPRSTGDRRRPAPLARKTHYRLQSVLPPRKPSLWHQSLKSRWPTAPRPTRTVGRGTREGMHRSTKLSQSKSPHGYSRDRRRPGNQT